VRGATCSIDGVEWDRLYNDGPDWPDTPGKRTAERAYRSAFLAAAKDATRWSIPDEEKIQAAWQARREARRRAEIAISSAEYLGVPGLDSRQTVYRKGHEVEASRTRGRVQALEIARADWCWRAGLGVTNPDEIRRMFMQPWFKAVTDWAAEPITCPNPPPEPLRRFSPTQWQLVLSKQPAITEVHDRIEDAEASLKTRYGNWSTSWKCYAEDDQLIGEVFRWERGTVRLISEHETRWAIHGDSAEAPVTPHHAKPHAVSRRLVAVQRETLEWLWPGRVPLGKLTLLAGDPGLGKSFVTLDMAARVSRGEAWPDTPLLEQPPGEVVLLNAEDDLADTIAPRLDRMNADDQRIVAIEGVADPNGRRHFSLKTDLSRLEEVLEPATKLVIIDPIDAYCDRVDSHKNAEVRALLAPLAELVGRHRVAIVAVTHLSKTGGTKAIYRAMGSLAFTAAARAVWAIVKDTADPQRRLFLPAKLNLARDPDGLAYRIAHGRVEWETEPVRMHADDAFAAEAAAAEPSRRGSERREAIEWLQEHLAGGLVPASEVIEIGQQFGFSKRTLQRAYKQIGAKPQKESFDGPWMWSLASQDATNPTSL